MSSRRLLEKATGIDPNYGQAHGLLAHVSHTFSAHMGWDDIRLPCRCGARRACCNRADSEDPWAHYALGNVYLFARRSRTCSQSSSWRCSSTPIFHWRRRLRSGPGVLRALGRSRRCSPSCAASKPRDPFSAIYYGIEAYAQFIGGNDGEAMSFSSRLSAAQRFRRRPPGSTAAAGMAGQYDVAKVALQELRRVQPNVSLAWIASQIPIKRDADREHYLEGFRRAGLD